jgi:hypothetical protein
MHNEPCSFLLSCCGMELALDIALYTFLQILSVHSFEKIPILQAFSQGDPSPAPTTLTKQLNLFNT